ncbi:hypothetical protein ACQPW1_12730 [Nocardia sp. CA-128927]|uniref:hypothetical protein n=1 Tax=Nocardia sp. CA-128927 TaxID=3239975 RepID=UPI003D9887F8
MRKLLQAIRRLLGGKVTTGGGRPGREGGGGTAGVREPRRPLPPDNHLSATRRIEPDPKTITFPDSRH